jgi:5-methyltetrahydrofolate--homocysteine methyltransferase
MRNKVKVMVGGAPVTQEWVKQIGADGYSEDAIGAARVAKQLLGV